MAHNVPGRHRAPGRFNPLAELRLIAKESAQPAVKGAAILAASGGLVATAFASPASAAEGPGTVVAAQARAGASVPAASGPAAGTVQVGAALSTIGFAPTPAVTKAAKPLPPRVIEDIVVKNARAAKAKAIAAAAAKVQAERAVKAKAEATRLAAQQAASQRATATQTSRSTTRSAAAPTVRTTTKKVNTTTKKKVNTAAPVQSASGLVGIAQRAFGVPYRYGGTSMSGFDCSGLTSWVYRQAGISIPRTASAQQSAATRVSSPRPGDLVFFGTPAYHVGIYVSPGRLIDAQRTGTVVGNHSIWTTPSGYGRV